MMIRNLLKWWFLQICLVSALLMQYVFNDCVFPEDELENGEFIYTSPNDTNLITAPEYYVLRFHCDNGHTVIGSAAIGCIEGSWTDEVPICKRLQCEQPPDVSNSRKVLNSGMSDIPWLGSSVTYSCNEGFEFVNEFVTPLHCVQDKGWNNTLWLGEIPVCKEKEMCRDPGESPDGTRSGECCSPGSILEFSCDENFELVGNQEIHCFFNGTWSSKRPLCRPKDDYCEYPPAIPHGYVTGKGDGDYFRSYDEAEIHCNNGYTHVGPSPFVLCEDDSWDVEFGECAELFCDEPKRLTNGTITELKSTNATSFPFLFQLTYICDPGYRLVGGDSWRFCKDGGWSGNTPHCEKIVCPVLKMPEYGSKEGNSVEVGAKVRYECFSGYDLLGSIERFCLPNGQWSGEIARCNLNSTHCPDPGIPVSGKKNSSNYELGSIIGFRCDEDYILVGSESRKCLLNRTWSGSETKCIGRFDYDMYTRIRNTMQFSLDNEVKEQNSRKKDISLHLSKRYIGMREEFGRKLDLSRRTGLVLYFVFDVSGSVGKNNFNKSVEFAKAIVKRVGISEGGPRAGAITFSSKAQVIFMPVIHTTTESVLEALNEMNYTGGGTSASSALTLVREQCIPLSQGALGKQGQKSIIFVLTDGRANMGGNPKEEADLLKKENVEIYSIGITGRRSQEALYQIASDPKEEHVFILENYATLAYLIQDITNGTIDYSQCGIGLDVGGSKSVTGKIIDGNKAVQPWPWIAAIFYSPHGRVVDNKVLCGGSVVSEYYIMTAAHCFYKDGIARDHRHIFVKLGLMDVKNDAFVQKPIVKRIIEHPDYNNAKNYDYDIALIRVKKAIEFNPYVRPICLPPLELPSGTSLYKPKEYVEAAGWGYNGTVPDGIKVKVNPVDNLKQVTIPIQSRNRCAKTLSEKNKDPSLFTDRMLCAGDGEIGNDTCHGDSGGPLIQPQMNTDGLYWTQVGIVSWGIGCGLKNTYGFYTHVQSLRSWIDSIITRSDIEIN